MKSKYYKKNFKSMISVTLIYPGLNNSSKTVPHRLDNPHYQILKLPISLRALSLSLQCLAGFLVRTLSFNLSYMCLIGLRSGLRGGQSVVSILTSSRNWRVIRAVRQRALSCIRRKPFPMKPQLGKM